MGQAPSQPGPPGTKFKVIGAGMCRTGTKSLNEALSILLGGPVHDSGVQSLGGSLHQVNNWLEIMKHAPYAKTLAQKKYIEYLLADLTDGYVATVDCPAVTLTPELMALYPDAVVIATTRDTESWWRSMEFVNGMMSNWYIAFVIMWVPKVGVYGRWRDLFRHMTLWRYGDELIVKETLAKHEDHLRGVVPKDRLFWYNVSEGWEPLCKILGVPVPDRPFPHNNSRKEAASTYRELILAGVVSWLFMLSVMSLLVWTLWGKLPGRELTGVVRSAYKEMKYSNTSSR
ncbi:hypothetical protein CONLIGDRAFT_289643 [Coniochaeta ligniaria NRRL 30616]|uniref:NAD dependent epimerase/dehydratase n=1 Tax=Coniochaeta ligniaria NRRL 30616 TaxID=1408157 RepID=A0A1J7JLK9_9PEZI|nr:hypothetical protein CONLIGDRAFT_289643 [Coniochaeta ligniaria NRRL 30616]